MTITCPVCHGTTISLGRNPQGINEAPDDCPECHGDGVINIPGNFEFAECNKVGNKIICSEETLLAFIKAVKAQYDFIHGRG